MAGSHTSSPHRLARRVGLFGASSLGKQCLAQLQAHAAEAIPACFFDNDARKWGATFEGVPVHEPSLAALQAVDVIWLTTTYADEVQAQLKKLGVATRVAFTLAEVLGKTAPSGGGPSVATFRSDGCWPRVNVVMADEGWILERCAREIEKRLPYVRATRQADPAAAINYYMNYAAYRGGVGGHQAGFFTHVEERAAGMPERFFRVARAMDVAVAMSDRYAVQLREAGIERVHVITPGIDLERFTPQVRIGVVGRTYQTGRKGDDLVRGVMDEPGIEWVFTGEGWPGPARMYSDDEMPEFYRSLDYLLVPAYYEGGPMPVLEALACGVEVIAPRVGFVDDYPHIEYAVGDATDLRRVLREVVATRMARRQSVESRTWDAWAQAHDQLFKDMTQTPSKVARASVPEPAIDFSTRKLRVLFALHAPESVTPVGGPSIRLPQTQRALAEFGVDADISREELPDPRGYDLVHVFNISERRAALRQLQHLRQFDVPVVFSPICLKVQEGYWAQRAVLPVFQQHLDEAPLREALARVAATPLDVREATGMAVDPSWGEKIREITALVDHLVMLSEREMTVLDEIGAISTPFSLVHNGVDPSWADGATGDLFKQTYGLDDYILCVGRLEPRKNQLMVARALRGTNINLVCLGAPHQPEYVELVRTHGNRVHIIDKLKHDDPLFRSAYAGARAFVLASWSEGAPLAALEAVSFGLPMVLSNRSSEPEYFGPLARYCDPLDLDGLRTALLEAFAEPLDSPLRAARKRLVETALSWSNTARETSQAYAKVLKDKRPAKPLPGGFTPPEPRRLEIGSGNTPQRGYEHLDARADLPDIDHVADIRHALPFPSGTFDEVMSRSCIEHVSWREVRQVLTEWGRILKPGGVLDVWTPDFEYLCRQYIARKDDRHLDPALADESRRAFGGYDTSAWAIIKMFGGQDYPENFHGTVMDEDVLTRVLEASGFTHVQRREPFTGLRLLARRAPVFKQKPLASESDTAMPGTWPGSVAPGVVWCGPAFDDSSYAEITRQAVHALVTGGVPVQLQPDDVESAARSRYLDAPGEAWIWKRALGRHLPGCAQVICGSPVDESGNSRYRAIRDSSAKARAYVGVVAAPATGVPSAWRGACADVDELWVPREDDKRAFVEAGIAGDRIQVLPDTTEVRHEPLASWIARRMTHLTPDPGKAMDFGRKAEAAGDLDEAARYYIRAADLRRGWQMPVYNRASVLKRQGRRDAALRLFAQVAERGETPELRGGSWYHQGELAFDANRLDQAADAFESCLRELPNHTKARAWIALIGGRRADQGGQLEVARDAYQQALSLTGDWALAQYSFASTLKRLGEPAGARMSFAQVAATAHQASLRGGAHFHLGELALADGDTDIAAGHFESCLLETPDHAAARRRFEELQVGAR
jgi:glycosyltransferase involved in cell wall biosynthesis/tetratricopeptide (TPR) repeat protein/predicted SAM-dependent methyltransferase